MTISEALNILGLRRPVNAAQIKMAFRKLARKYHPDAAGVEQHTLHFVELKNAYDMLNGKSEAEINDSGFNTQIHQDLLIPRADRSKIVIPDTQFYRDLDQFFSIINKLFANKFIGKYLSASSRWLFSKKKNTGQKILNILLGFMFILFLFAVGLAMLLVMGPIYFLYASVSDYYYSKHLKTYLIARFLFLSILLIVNILLGYYIREILNIYIWIIYVLMVICNLFLMLHWYVEYRNFKRVSSIK
jgi:hypothetical protein